MARRAVPPHERNPELPGMVSSIIAKLLEKSAEDRYQTARGLRMDLEKCLIQLEDSGYIKPFAPGAMAAIPDIARVKMKLMFKNIPDLIDIPEMEDKKQISSMLVLINACTTAFICAPKYMPVFVMKLLLLTLKHGNTPASAFAYAMFGTILGFALNQYDDAYEMGQLALRTVEKFNARFIESRTLFICGTMLCHWKEPLGNCIPYLEKGLRSGPDAGELQWVSYHLNQL